MRRWLLIPLLAVALVSGCAAPRPAPPPDPSLFADELFGAQAIPTDQDVFAMDDEMRDFLRREVEPLIHHRGAPNALYEALYSRSRLRLRYDASITRNAREAFHARAGNCMSLVIMTAAFAKSMGLTAHYRRIYTEAAYSRRGGLQFESGHVNVSLGRLPDPQRGGASDPWLVIDFLPADEVRGYRSQEIDEATLLGMFLTNRAAEALAEGRTDAAYAWAKESVRRSPDYHGGYNVLGVAYWRAGHLARAAQALQAGLLRAPDQASLLSNLGSVLKSLGRHDEAEAAARRLRDLEPYPPYHFFDLGMAALQRGDVTQARDWFAREVARAEDHAEFHYWLAVAHGQLGELRQARQHLSAAAQLGMTEDERGRYSAKLTKLKAAAGAR